MERAGGPDDLPLRYELEDDTIEAYNQFLLVCRDNGDSISVKLFETIIDDEQMHFNYFDNVQDHIQKLGRPTWPRSPGPRPPPACSPRGLPSAAGAPSSFALCVGALPSAL